MNKLNATYVMVVEDNSDRFADEVNRRLEQGYKLIGPIRSTPSAWEADMAKGLLSVWISPAE